MAVILKPKRSETASSVPTTSDLEVGEIAINTADSKLYVRDSSDSIVSIGGGLSVTDTDTTVDASSIQFSDTSTALMQITDDGSGVASVTVTINGDQDYGLITDDIGVGNNIDYGGLS